MRDVMVDAALALLVFAVALLTAAIALGANVDGVSGSGSSIDHFAVALISAGKGTNHDD